MKGDFNKKEIKDIAISTIALAFAFGWGYRDGGLVFGMFYALVGVGIGFILHELAHRYFARKFGAHAKFKMWPAGLLMAVVISLVSNGAFVFAAPGAVYIYPNPNSRWYKLDHRMENEERGIISIAGPATNIALAAVFIILHNFTGFGLFSFAAMINAWLALFNSIPFHPLDGAKIMAWDPKAWLLLVSVSIVTLLLI